VPTTRDLVQHAESQLAESSEPGQRVLIVSRISREHEPKNPQAALRLWLRLLLEMPSHAQISTACERLAEATGHWDWLGDVLEQAGTDPERPAVERGQFLRRAAAAAEEDDDREAADRRDALVTALGV